MRKGWKCPKCGKVVTKYTTICDECDGTRGFFNWMWGTQRWGVFLIGGLLCFSLISLCILIISLVGGT